jgi:hypothetical protein
LAIKSDDGRSKVIYYILTYGPHRSRPP